MLAVSLRGCQKISAFVVEKYLLVHMNWHLMFWDVVAHDDDLGEAESAVEIVDVSGSEIQSGMCATDLRANKEGQRKFGRSERLSGMLRVIGLSNV